MLLRCDANYFNLRTEILQHSWEQLVTELCALLSSTHTGSHATFISTFNLYKDISLTSTTTSTIKNLGWVMLVRCLACAYPPPQVSNGTLFSKNLALHHVGTMFKWGFNSITQLLGPLEDLFRLPDLQDYKQQFEWFQSSSLAEAGAANSKIDVPVCTVLLQKHQNRT